MSTHFDLSTYIYSNLLNSKNVPRQFAAAIANCRGSLDPISRAEKHQPKFLSKRYVREHRLIALPILRELTSAPL